MSTSGKDTKTFIKEVTRHLRHEGAGGLFTKKVSSLFRKMSKAAAGGETAVVDSVVSLTWGERKLLESVIAKKTEGTTQTVYRIKPDLLCGMRIRVGDLLIDGSGKHLVNQMSLWMRS